MKKKNIFLEILTYVGLILWAVAFFLGLNYVVKGALMVSITISIFLFLVMFVLVYAMKKYGNGENENVHTASNTHKLALVLYAVVSLGTAIFLCHFVKVTTEDQQEIQNKAKQEIQELGRIFSDDCVPGSYMQWVAEETDNLRIKLEGEGMGKSTIDTRLSELEDDLVDRSGFNTLRDDVKDFLSHCDYSVSNWIWPTIPLYLSSLEKNMPDYEEQVVECSKKSDYTADAPFTCNSEHYYPGLAQSLEKVSFSDISLWSILFIVILQIFILLSYFLGKPDRGEDPTKFEDEWGRTWNSRAKKGSKPTHSKKNDEEFVA